jgi:hypothetical protein
MMMRFVFRVLLSMINIQGIRMKFESEVICLYRIQDVEDDDMDEAPGVKTPALVVGKKSAKPAEEESDDDEVRLRLVSGSTRITTLKNIMFPWYSCLVLFLSFLFTPYHCPTLTQTLTLPRTSLLSSHGGRARAEVRAR